MCPPGSVSVQFDPLAFVADPELVSALEERATPIPCDSDRVLFRQGEPAVGLYIIRKGKATLMMCAAGNEIMKMETGSGSLLGLPASIGNQPYSLTAQAHQGAQVKFISRDDFNALMHSDSDLAFKILQVLANEVRSARFALY